MKPTELRIGNLIMHTEFDLIYEIGAISNHFLSCYPFGNPLNSIDFLPDICKGIPLTEGWLLKFDFNKSVNGRYVHNKQGDFLVDVEGNIFKASPKTNYWKQIKYAHELQNFFYATIGEEVC